MKRLSDELNELSVHAKKTEDVVDAAVTKDRERLHARLTTLKAAVDAQNAKAAERATQARTDVETKWIELRNTLDGHFADIRSKAQQHKAERDTRRAEHRADDAEQDALVAVGFAIYALDQAEYAIIEAAVSRVEADELAARH